MLIGFFSAVGLMILIVFLSDTSSFDLQNPPNPTLVALADQFDATFDEWTTDDQQIAFTFSVRVSSANVDLTAEELQAAIEAEAVRLGLDSLRITAVTRFTASYKVSGYVDAT